MKRDKEWYILGISTFSSGSVKGLTVSTLVPGPNATTWLINITLQRLADAPIQSDLQLSHFWVGSGVLENGSRESSTVCSPEPGLGTHALHNTSC